MWSGIDLLPIEPIPGATLMQGDLTDPACEQALLALLGGKPDLVLSDMAPNTTGHAATDHIRIMALAELALETALPILAEGGGFVCKLFQGGAERAMLERLKRSFRSVRHAKPPASREGVERAVRGGDGVSRIAVTCATLDILFFVYI